MSKFLYISPTGIDFNQLDGVQKKIINQSKAFVGFGYDVDILTFFDDSIVLYNVKEGHSIKVAKGRSKTGVLRNVHKVIKGYVGVYIRYPMSDMFLIQALRAIKRYGIPVVLEIPTFPYDTENRHSIKGKVITFLDVHYRKKLKRYVDRICTYSDDRMIFGIPTINTINGIDFSNYEPDYSDVDFHQCINLIAVSGMYVVHGYDRLIKGLGNYYASGGDRNIVLHVVGSGVVDNQYKELVEQLQMKNHVVFHGKKFGVDLLELYKGQALGVNSLAIHRANLVNESTLKTKEYAALGLPVISSSYVDAFSHEGNEKYALRVPPDETDIDINTLVEFVDILYSEPVGEVRKNIRADAKSVCDMSITLKPVLDYFEIAKQKNYEST